MKKIDKKKIIVFRANFGNYDNLKNLEDYKFLQSKKYLFTDNKKQVYKDYKIKVISKKKVQKYLKSINLYKKEITNTDLNRIIKIYPFHFFKNCEYIVYTDSRISILGSLNNLIGKKDQWIGLRHRFSKSVFDELKACYFNSKIKYEEFKSFYKEKKNFKQYSRFTENGFIIRKNCSQVRKVSKIWLKKYLNGPYRDQLHLVNIREFKNIKLKLLDFDLNTKNSILKMHSRGEKNFQIFFSRMTKLFKMIFLYINLKKL